MLYVFIKLISKIVQILPEKFLFLIVDLLARVIWFKLKFTPFHNFIQNNIRQAFKDRYTSCEIEDLTRRHLSCLLKSLVEFMRLPGLNLDQLEKKIKIKNIHYLDEALNKGRGVILLSAHFGNWEMGAALLGLKGYPIYAMYQEQSSKSIDRWLNEVRLSKGVRPVWRWQTLRRIITLLKTGCIIAIMGDQHGEFENVFAEFFGHRVSVPAGPVAFALKTGAQIIPAFMIRNADDTHTEVFEPPLELTRTGNRKRDLEENSLKFLRIFEKYISWYPEQWFWVYNRWDKLRKK